jgi:cyclase
MLKKRIIPCLDVKNGQVVKGVKFEGLKILGDPVAFARQYERSGADELVLYDIGVSLEARQIAASLVTEIKKVFSLPLTVGGGVTVLSDVDRLFESGADKVSINSGAHKTPGLIQQASLKYGRQSIVGSVDTARLGTEEKRTPDPSPDDTLIKIPLLAKGAFFNVYILLNRIYVRFSSVPSRMTLAQALTKSLTNFS